MTYRRHLRYLDTFRLIEKFIEFDRLGFFHSFRVSVVSRLLGSLLPIASLLTSAIRRASKKVQPPCTRKGASFDPKISSSVQNSMPYLRTTHLPAHRRPARKCPERLYPNQGRDRAHAGVFEEQTNFQS